MPTGPVQVTDPTTEVVGVDCEGTAVGKRGDVAGCASENDRMVLSDRTFELHLPISRRAILPAIEPNLVRCSVEVAAQAIEIVECMGTGANVARFGDFATAAVAVNCVPAMVEASPGLRTSRDIPMSYLPGEPTP